MGAAMRIARAVMRMRFRKGNRKEGMTIVLIHSYQFKN